MKGVLLLGAALVCSVLLTSCGKAGPRTEAKPTASSTSAATPLSKRLVTGQVVTLRDGVISAHLQGTTVSFEPPASRTCSAPEDCDFLGRWYGFKADETGFVVGDRPDGLQQRTRSNFGVGVNRIELPLKQAAKQLEKTPGVRVLSVDKGEIFDHPAVPYPRLNGHPAHLYDLLLTRPELHEIFGIPARSFSRVNHPQRGALKRRVEVLLIGAGRKTFLVRFGNHATGIDDAYFTLISLRFHTDVVKSTTLGARDGLGGFTATVRHPLAMKVRLRGAFEWGHAEVSCSRGSWVVSYRRKWPGAGTYKLPVKPRRAERCRVELTLDVKDTARSPGHATLYTFARPDGS